MKSSWGRLLGTTIACAGLILGCGGESDDEEGEQNSAVAVCQSFCRALDRDGCIGSGGESEAFVQLSDCLDYCGEFPGFPAACQSALEAEFECHTADPDACFSYEYGTIGPCGQEVDARYAACP
jgi:hypothetical protein